VYRPNLYVTPRVSRFLESRALRRSTLFTYRLPNARKFPCHLTVTGNDVIECICNLSMQASLVTGKTNGEIPISHGLQAGQYYAEIDGHGAPVTRPVPIFFQARFGIGACRHDRHVAFDSLHHDLRSNQRIDRPPMRDSAPFPGNQQQSKRGKKQ
jgi:hypothetical protein